MLRRTPALPDPPELAAFPVSDPVPIVSTHAARTRRCSWPATATGWSTPPAPASSTARELHPLLSASLDDDEIARRSRRRRRAAGHRLEPQAGRALDHHPPHPGLHRAGRRGAARHRPHRQPPAGVPRRPTATPMTVAVVRGRRRGQGHQLRQPDHVHHPRSGRPGRRRRPRDRLAHRGVLRRPGRAPRADADRAGDHRPHHPDSSPPTAPRNRFITNGAAALRRRRPGRRRPRPPSPATSPARS